MKIVLRWMRERQKLRLIYATMQGLTTNFYIQLCLQNPTSIRQNQLIIHQNQSSHKINGFLTKKLAHGISLFTWPKVPVTLQHNHKMSNYKLNATTEKCFSMPIGVIVV
jgi:hypothetical protein